MPANENQSTATFTGDDARIISDNCSLRIELAGTQSIFCQNCQEIRTVVDNHCSGCAEMICGKCGCTDSEACAETCEWMKPGLCSNCEESEL